MKKLFITTVIVLYFVLWSVSGYFDGGNVSLNVKETNAIAKVYRSQSHNHFHKSLAKN